MHKSSNETLIAALMELSRTIQCDDGLANAVCAEAAERIRELQAEIDRPRKE